MGRHRLDPLLAPRALAIVGASDRPASNGRAMVEMAAIDGFRGAVHPVNPRLTAIDGAPCHPTLAALPAPPEHVAIGVAASRVAATLEQAIAAGARAATIFAALDADQTRQVAACARAAGLALCGPNGMGFYNPAIGLRVASFPSPPGLRSGGVAWIAQSGSAMGALAHNDRRLGFSLCVSTGAELCVSAADYMDWALDQPQTRVVGLFLETVRDPAAFVAALEKAAARDVPVVALKVGRTARSARMALSHTGAMVGDDAAFDALCRRHGMARVDDMDEMAATLALLDAPRRPAAGALATIHDSGGERELVADLAAAEGVAFAEIAGATRAALAAQLEPGLTPDNPLDAYGTSNGYQARYTAVTQAMLADPAVSMALFMANPRDDYWYAEGYAEAMAQAAARSDKPLAVASCYSLADDRKLALRLAQAGVPLLRGARNALRAARHAMAWRDHRAAARPAPPAAPPAAVTAWRARLRAGGRLSEDAGLALLADFGLRTPRRLPVEDAAQALAAARILGGEGAALALKTAQDHPHKSDVGGVRLGLAGPQAVADAHAAMAARLGPAALVMEMAPPGVEIALGGVIDPAFGPMVMIAAGGVLVETLGDRVTALAPVDAAQALALLGRLRVAPLLGGVRGAAPADMDDLCRQIAAFSAMLAALRDEIAEIDVNPLIAGPGGAMAVDCLATARAQPSDETRYRDRASHSGETSTPQPGASDTVAQPSAIA